jgi:hypothetical protein
MRQSDMYGSWLSRKMIMHHVHACPAEHEVLPVSEGHRVTLTYNLRALRKPAEPLNAQMTPAVHAAKLAAAEQTVAAYIATESQDGSSCHTSSSGSGSST